VANLLENAIKFSPPGSPVEVELREAGPGEMRLSVRDHGVGVAAEHRPHIFERFYQAHPEQHTAGGVSLGLGLYICRRIVELHGGAIRAEFPADGGTRVLVRLPILAREPAAPALLSSAQLVGRPANSDGAVSSAGGR
jgi:signal transduction histidine kinase